MKSDYSGLIISKKHLVNSAYITRYITYNTVTKCQKKKQFDDYKTNTSSFNIGIEYLKNKQCVINVYNSA